MLLARSCGLGCDSALVFMRLCCHLAFCRNTARAQLDDMVKFAHNNVLQEKFPSGEYASSLRYKRYREIYWWVQRSESDSLMLGDVGVLQFEHQSRKFSAAFNGAVGDVILLPVSHDMLVIGSAEEAGPLPSFHAINRASAAGTVLI